MSCPLFNASSQEIFQAAQLLIHGKTVAIPTETVYGLAANAYNPTAVAYLYQVKNRPQFNPLIVHYSSLCFLKQDVHWNETAEKLAAAFWPGPLTLILPRNEKSQIPPLVSAGLSTVAVRIPQHPVALSLLSLLPFPLAAPSANPSGFLSPTQANHVQNTLADRIAGIIDGGPCTLGIESTVIDVSQEAPVLLRPGGIDLATIEAILGTPLMLFSLPESRKRGKKSPGLLASHYAPRQPVRLNATSVSQNEGLLAFGSAPCPGALITLNLSRDADMIEAASRFFSYLHELHTSPCEAIAVMPIPETGLGAALNDRLRRAAAPRQ